jgi:hypothetical protein
MTKKLKPADYEPESIPLSANRQALADLNTSRSEAAAEVEELRARVASLARLRDAVGPIENELSALDSAEAAALAEWSVTPDEPAPEPDVATRDDIAARLQAARQKVHGADAATISVEHVLASANQRAGELERQVPALIAAVLIDEARSLLPSVIEAVAAVAKVQGRYLSLRRFLLGRAEDAKDIAMRNGFFQQLELLDREAADAAALAPTLSFNAGDEWKSLALELGDTAIRPTPTLPTAFPNMPVADQWINS